MSQSQTTMVEGEGVKTEKQLKADAKKKAKLEKFAKKQQSKPTVQKEVFIFRIISINSFSWYNTIILTDIY